MKLVQTGIRISPEAKKKIEEQAKKNHRSVSKEIEHMILESKDKEE